MEIYCVEKNITSRVGHLSPSTLYLRCVRCVDAFLIPERFRYRLSKQIMEIKDFFLKVDVYKCLKQIMEIKDFFFKKGDEKFCAEEYRDVFKGEFCC